MDLALVLDLLLVREDVVEEAGVVDGRVLQGADGAAAVDLGRDGRAVAHPAQAQGEVGAEGGAPHLQVVDRVGDAVLELVGQLPHPALGHRVDRAFQGAPLVGGHPGGGARPQVGQGVLHGVRGDERRLPLDGHAGRQAGRGHLRGGQVAAVAVDERVVVVAVGAEGEPLRAQVEGFGGGVGVDPRRAQREVVGGELVLVPHALGEDAGAVAPLGQGAAGRVQVGTELQRVRHVQVGDAGRADLLEGHVRVGAQTLRSGRREQRAHVGRRGAGAGRAFPGVGGAGPFVHVPAGAHVPLVAAGLPVLQPLGVRRHRRDLVRGKARLHGQCGDFGERGVLELVQPGGEHVVDAVGGLLGGAAEEGLQHQDAVAELPLVLDLPLVGEQVVAQVHGVGEGLHQHPERPGSGDGGGHFGGRVLHEPRRPGGAADLAAHLDVLDGVGDPPLVDVGQFPQGLVQQVLGRHREPPAPAVRHRGHRARPQVGEARLDRVLRLGHGGGGVQRHEQGQPVQVRLAAGAVLAALEGLQEVVVEEEDPHVPVGDQGQGGSVAVGVGVGAEQSVVVRVEVGLLPDPGTLQHAHLARPPRRVGTGLVDVRVEPRGIRHVEVREFEGLLRHGRGPTRDTPAPSAGPEPITPSRESAGEQGLFPGLPGPSQVLPGPLRA